MKIKNLLTSPSKWTKKFSSRDNKGNPVGIFDKKACRFCLSGAIERCYTEEYSWHYADYKKIEEKVNKYLEKLGFEGDLVAFNDDPKTKFKDIKKLVEKLNI